MREPTSGAPTANLIPFTERVLREQMERGTSGPISLKIVAHHDLNAWDLNYRAISTLDVRAANSTRVELATIAVGHGAPRLANELLEGIVRRYLSVGALSTIRSLGKAVRRLERTAPHRAGAAAISR